MKSRISIQRILGLLILGIILGSSIPAGADGLIMIPPPFPMPPNPRPIPSDPFPLEVVYHRVTVDIADQTATTSIDQSFFNPTSQRLEGYYLFPIPAGAVIKDFSMEINGKKTSAELLDASKARKIYEDIVRQMRDPALLEYSDRGLFRVRIFPIEPRSEKKVTLTYRQVLAVDGGTHEYVYPLNTEKFSAKPLQDVSITINLKTTEPLKTIYCPTHEVDIRRRGENQAVISFEARNVKPDIDFKFYFDTNRQNLGITLLSYRVGNDDGFFFLTASPAVEPPKDEINEKDITFVLDVSGSMAGEKLDQAKKALRYCIDNLNKGDRFELIRFSTEAYGLFRELTPFNEASLAKARQFINELKPVGGTNIEEALQMALKAESSPGRSHLIIFMTDGKPTIGETNEDKLLQSIGKVNPAQTRIFTFGIGDDLNTHLLDRLTELTRASRTYIGPNEDIELKVSSFYNKVQSPVLSDVKLDFGREIDVIQLYPQHLPDLFRGSEITVFGRYKKPGGSTAVISGLVRGKKVEFKSTVEFVRQDTRHDFIPPIWAARRIGFLLDQIRLHGADKELVDEVTQLARTYGIVTPYTSYLIIEDETIRTTNRTITPEFQTMGGAVPSSGAFKSRVKEEYDAMEKKDGAPSVQVSREFQALNGAENFSQAAQGSKRLDFTDAKGTTRNMSQQVRNIQGRAVYQSGTYWVDSRLQQVKSTKNMRIQFGSKEYFDLVQQKPAVSQFLALGQNVRFHHDGINYEIYE